MRNSTKFDSTKYRENGRLKYNPAIHINHCNPWTKKELLYLCGMWQVLSSKEISSFLGRTEGTCVTKVCLLRKEGLFEEYKENFKSKR